MGCKHGLGIISNVETIIQRVLACMNSAPYAADCSVDRVIAWHAESKAQSDSRVIEGEGFAKSRLVADL